MEARYIEPRKVMWAVAEVWWADAAGKACQSPATIQDMSASGACLRMRNPIAVGAKVKVRWRREQFSAVARNCRKDGMDFLLGVRREEDSGDSGGADVAGGNVASKLPRETEGMQEASSPRAPAPAAPASLGKAPSQSGDAAALRERKVMEPKKLFPQFWRRQQEPGATEPVRHTEAPVNKVNDSSAKPASGPRNELLSYEDIYHAAGIMSPQSGYGIQKVVEMLNSERIRDLSKDIKRASVLMALDAAGASAEELLQDATRRQNALNSYEEGQRKQVEEFESRKARENAHIQAEMEKVVAHYSERMQRNRDQVAREKEALRNWQMAKQHEMQRIAEVIEVCSKQPAPLAIGAAASQSVEGAAPGSIRPETRG